MLANNLLIEETERIKFLMFEQVPDTRFGPERFMSGTERTKNVHSAQAWDGAQKKEQEFNSKLSSKMKDTVEWVKTWDKHDWLTFVELTSAILSAIPQPLAPITTPVLLSISTSAGLANAALYFNEGDPYMGGLMLAFSVLPVGALVSNLKGAKTFMRLGAKESIRIIRAAKAGTATPSEFKTAQELIKEIAPQANKLAEETIKYTIKQSLKQLPKRSLQFILKLCIGMSKLGVFGIKEGIVIAGTFFTYDKIYKILNYKNEKNLSIREKNELVKCYNILWENEEEIKKQLIE